MKKEKQPEGYPDSYYVATATQLQERPVHSGNLRADVCIIGAGFTGLSAAVNLAEQGLDVVVLEAERVGFGASGRCGGLIGSGQRKDIFEMESQFGFERSRAFWDIAEAAKAEIRHRVDKHSIDCDLQKGQLLGVHKKSYLGWSQQLADIRIRAASIVRRPALWWRPTTSSRVSGIARPLPCIR
jgi:glycine/D-amino acid oxidase-like deaminating enzyme